MERYRVVRLEEQMYGCEELPEGAEVCCDVTVEAADGTRKDPVLPRRRADTAGHRRGRYRALGRHGPAQSLTLEKSWKKRGTS